MTIPKLNVLQEFQPLTFWLAFFLSIVSGLATANPEGGEVVAGSGQIFQTSGDRLDVIQGSDRLGINWESFSIGRGEQVNFNQPSSSSVVLNRVVGPEVSNIEGLLTANGNVFLVNQNGVFFHKGSVVDVGGFLATTTDLSNQDFIAGRYRFNEESNPNGRIVNEGTITAAQGGLVALVAPSVRNSGVIEARLGRVVLGSGNVYTLDLFGDDLVTFAVDDKVAQRLTGLDGEAVDALVEQSGVIDAPGGRVLLTAEAAGAVVGSVINLTGVVQARSVSGRDGRIVLHGGDEGLVQVAGTLDTSGDQGGQVEVLGGEIELASAARIDASGTGGGGEIYIGGDYQGKGDRHRAALTSIASGAEVRADATGQGDGGTVIVWSDDRTVVDGSLSARGGPDGGDGGLIETSSAGELEFSRSVRVSAPRGEAGTWLLDPEDIEIDRGKADSIEDTLNDGGNVSIKTSDNGDGEGNIYVNASITKTEGEDAGLSMRAHGKIDVNKPIRSEEGELDVSLKAGREVNVNADIDTNGGKFSTSITGVPEEPKDEPEEEPEIAEEPEAVEEPEVAEDAAEPDEQGEEVVDTEAPEGVEGEGGVLVELTEGEPEEEFMESPGELVVELGDGEEVRVEVEPGEGEDVADKVEEVANGIDSVTHVTSTGSEPNESTPSQMPLITVTDSSVTTQGGEISLDAGDEGGVFITGNLDSSDTAPEGTGGDIEVLGKHIVIAGDATIDSSGDEGGGDIHIGGDYQGKGERQRSESTTIGERVTIRSDATANGDAGDVVIWSDGTTQFQGKISARGGVEGGDGGRVEVSGKENLGYWGEVDAGAPKGDPGSLLLDPSFLRIVDAERGGGDQDLNVLCASYPTGCFLPPQLVIDIYADWTLELLQSFGIDPNPETALNTLSWGRLQQLARATFNSIILEADGDITFAALNGAVSTPGSPNGDSNGYTVKLELADPGGDYLRFSVKSNAGDIVFENTDDSLVLVNNSVGLFFEAPTGNLRLGNVFSVGKPVASSGSILQGADFKPFDANWTTGSIDLSAGGDIETGALSTRILPGKHTDPVTGLAVPQPLFVVSKSTFDASEFDETNNLFITSGIYPDDLLDVLFNPVVFSDPGRGGDVNIDAGGSINIQGPVTTGSGNLNAEAGGDFNAKVIDTGANRLIVRSGIFDPGSLNTLNAGEVTITADKIAFDRINAGKVELTTRSSASDAISGEVKFDTFRNSDFIGSRPESEGFGWRDASSSGLVVNRAGSSSDVFNPGPRAVDTASGLGTIYPGLRILNGAASPSPERIPLAMLPRLFNGVLAPNAVPVDVPLDLPDEGIPGPVAASVPLESAPADIGPVSDSSSSTVAIVDTSGQTTQVANVETGPLSSADVQRIKDEGKDERVTNEPGSCTDEDRFEWLERGARSAARELDFGRRSGIGTDPEDTRDVFKADNCYFTHTTAAMFEVDGSR